MDNPIYFRRKKKLFQNLYNFYNDIAIFTKVQKNKMN